MGLTSAQKLNNYTSDHIFRIVTHKLMKLTGNVVSQKSYMLNKFGGHVTFVGGVTV